MLPVANPDQLGMFQQKQVNAVWTVEPWVTRLLRKGNGKVFYDEKDVITTWLASSVKFSRDIATLRKRSPTWPAITWNWSG